MKFVSLLLFTLLAGCGSASGQDSFSMFWQNGLAIFELNGAQVFNWTPYNSTHGKPAVTFPGMVFASDMGLTSPEARIMGGSLSLSLRNADDSRDNLIVYDDGRVVAHNTITIPRYVANGDGIAFDYNDSSSDLKQGMRIGTAGGTASIFIENANGSTWIGSSPNATVLGSQTNTDVHVIANNQIALTVKANGQIIIPSLAGVGTRAVMVGSNGTLSAP